MKKVAKILEIVFAVLTFVFAILELLNIYNSNYYTLTLGFIPICEYILKKDEEKIYSIISLVIGILLIISFIIYII